MRQVLSPLAFVAVASLPTASTNSGAIVQGPNGILFFSDGTNWWPLNDRYPAAAKAASSGSITNSETYISQAFSIPANTLAAGMAFRIRAFGVCTASASSKVGTFSLRFGTAGTTSDAAIIAPTTTSATSGTSVPFSLEFIVTVQSIGSSGTLAAAFHLLNNGITGISTAAVVVSSGAAAATVNTTVANKLGLSFSFASSGPSAIFNHVTVEQIK